MLNLKSYLRKALASYKIMNSLQIGSGMKKMNFS